MAVSARTRRLLAWLPAAVITVIIVAVVIVSLSIQESWWTQENPPASADQKASDGSSMLTDAGFDYVNVEGIVRVRIGEGGLSATELGLPADGEKTAEFRRPVRAVVAAGEDVHLLDDISRLTATAEGDRLVALSLEPDGSSGWSGAVGFLQALAPDFGWDAAQLDGLDDELADFNRSGEGDTFESTVGPATAGSATVTGTLVYERGSGATRVSITFAPAD